MIAIGPDGTLGHQALHVSPRIWQMLVLHMDEPVAIAVSAIAELDPETSAALVMVVPALASHPLRTLRSALRAEQIHSITAPGRRWWPVQETRPCPSQN